MGMFLLKIQSVFLAALGGDLPYVLFQTGMPGLALWCSK